jgi:hypothetical protein
MEVNSPLMCLPTHQHPLLNSTWVAEYDLTAASEIETNTVEAVGASGDRFTDGDQVPLTLQKFITFSMCMCMRHENKNDIISRKENLKFWIYLLFKSEYGSLHHFALHLKEVLTNKRGRSSVIQIIL